MANIRLLPPTAPGRQSATANGRSYSCAVGSTIDVLDADAAVLSANGWAKVGVVGPTSARPATDAGGGRLGVAHAGLHYLDTTVGDIIVWDGATWRSISGVAV